MTGRVLVTGGAKGIGRAVCDLYAKAGWEVLAPPRTELDLASTDSIARFVAKGLSVDALVNNAGENVVMPLVDVPLDQWTRIITVNLTAAFLLTQAVAKSMIEKKWGRIVNVSSCFSLLSKPGRGAYSASKSGLNGLTRNAALEFGESGVLVNAVCPGFVETEMTRRNNTETQVRAIAEQTALKRLAQPDEIAEFVYFLGSEKNTYITGQALVIDGGFSCK